MIKIILIAFMNLSILLFTRMVCTQIKAYGLIDKFKLIFENMTGNAKEIKSYYSKGYRQNALKGISGWIKKGLFSTDKKISSNRWYAIILFLIIIIGIFFKLDNSIGKTIIGKAMAILFIVFIFIYMGKAIDMMLKEDIKWLKPIYILLIWLTILSIAMQLAINGLLYSNTINIFLLVYVIFVFIIILTASKLIKNEVKFITPTIIFIMYIAVRFIEYNYTLDIKDELQIITMAKDITKEITNAILLVYVVSFINKNEKSKDKAILKAE